MEGLVSTKASGRFGVFAFKVYGFIGERGQGGSFGDFRMLNVGEERCEQGVALCNVSGTGWMWDMSLVMWAGEGAGMSWWDLGGVRVQVDGAGEYLGTGEVAGVSET